MGKIIKDGFDFMRYVNSGLIRKIEDIPELKHELITLSETKTHLAMSHYALLLGEHILDIAGISPAGVIDDCFAVVTKWQRGQVHFQAARDVADDLNRLARAEKDPIHAKAFRAMGQIAATPHVRWHALAASEYAVVVRNLMHPGDMDKVREERLLQICLLKGI